MLCYAAGRFAALQLNRLAAQAFCVSHNVGAFKAAASSDMPDSECANLQRLRLATIAKWRRRDRRPSLRHAAGFACKAPTQPGSFATLS
jgi:hypothetical protein